MFIPLPIDGHLDFSQFGAITYEALINIHIQVFGHMLSLLLGKYQKVEWIGHMVDSFLTFFRNAKLVSKVVIPFYNPPLSEEEFQLLHILPTLDIVRFF